MARGVTVLRAKANKKRYNDVIEVYGPSYVAGGGEGSRCAHVTYCGQDSGRDDRYIFPGSILVYNDRLIGQNQILGVVYSVDELKRKEGMKGKLYRLETRPIRVFEETVDATVEAIEACAAAKNVPISSRPVFARVFGMGVSDVFGSGSGNQFSGIIRNKNVPMFFPEIPDVPGLENFTDAAHVESFLRPNL